MASPPEPARAGENERRLWVVAGVVLALYYAATYPAQFLLDALRARNLLRLTLALMFLAVVAVLARRVWRARPGLREGAVLAVLAGVYIVLLARLSVLQERVHFVQYGVLAVLLVAALRAGVARRRGAGGPLRDEEMHAGAASGAALLTGLAGWGDEGIQALLPNRVYDLRDVGFNALAGVLAAGGLEARRWARGHDRARGRARPEPPVPGSDGPAGGFLAILLGLILGLALAPGAPRAAVAAGADASTAPGPRWSLLLITVDSLRADHVGAYGYPRPTTPRIDALAAGGAVFRDATGVAAWTGPGILSLLLGQYPAVVAVDARGKTADPFLPAPLEELERRGYRVEGFQGTVDPYRNLGLRPIDRMGEPVGTTLGRFAADPDRPFVYWHHIRAVHLPYACRADLRAAFDRPSEPRLPADQLAEITSRQILVAGSVGWDRRARPHVEDLYDACVRQADEEVGQALDALRAHGLEDSTVVVLTADHGEELLDRGEVGHASTHQAARLHPEILDIPLVVRLPARAGGGRFAGQVSGLAQPVDVMPTFFDLLGIRDWPWFQGLSLVPSLQTGAPVEREAAFAETTRCGWQCGSWRDKTVRVRAARDARWHFMEERDETGRRTGAWLFDRRSDPGATRDAARGEPAAARALERSLARRSREDLDLAERLVRFALAARREAPRRGDAVARTCDELTNLRDVYRVANPSLLDRPGFARWFDREVRSILALAPRSEYWACRALRAGR